MGIYGKNADETHSVTRCFDERIHSRLVWAMGDAVDGRERDRESKELSIPVAFKAAGLMVPEPSVMSATPFKAFVGWRVGG